MNDYADAEKQIMGCLLSYTRGIDRLDPDGVIELIPDPDGRIGFDSEQMFANSPAGRSSHNN